MLSDGVAYAAKHLAPDCILDMATLTGAQMVTHGRRVASLLTNDQDWEDKAILIPIPIPLIPCPLSSCAHRPCQPSRRHRHRSQTVPARTARPP